MKMSFIPIARGAGATGGVTSAVAVAIGMSGVLAAAWATTTGGGTRSLMKNGMLDSARASSSEKASASHECDCAALWACMQRGGGDECAVLEAQLRLCLEDSSKRSGGSS